MWMSVSMNSYVWIFRDQNNRNFTSLRRENSVISVLLMWVLCGPTANLMHSLWYHLEKNRANSSHEMDQQIFDDTIMMHSNSSNIFKQMRTIMRKIQWSYDITPQHQASSLMLIWLRQTSSNKPIIIMAFDRYLSPDEVPEIHRKSTHKHTHIEYMW